MPQGQSYPIRFLREDNSFQDPIFNNLNTNNPSYPYTSSFTALWAALGLPTAKTLFRAHMTSRQTIAPGADVKLNMDIADVDLPAGHYSTANKRWTPAAGTVHIHAIALAVAFTTTDSCALGIVKNGSFALPISQDVMKVAGGFMVASANLIDQASGTDFYEVYFVNTGTTNSVILDAFKGNTAWGGIQWPGP